MPGIFAGRTLPPNGTERTPPLCGRRPFDARHRVPCCCASMSAASELSVTSCAERTLPLVGRGQSMRGTTCHAAAASKDVSVVYARRHASSVSCPLGSIQPMHGITCRCTQGCGRRARRSTARRAHAAILWATADDCTASCAALQSPSRARLWSYARHYAPSQHRAQSLS